MSLFCGHSDCQHSPGVRGIKRRRGAAPHPAPGAWGRDPHRAGLALVFSCGRPSPGPLSTSAPNHHTFASVVKRCARARWRQTNTGELRAVCKLRQSRTSSDKALGMLRHDCRTAVLEHRARTNAPLRGDVAAAVFKLRRVLPYTRRCALGQMLKMPSPSVAALYLAAKRPRRGARRYCMSAC